MGVCSSLSVFIPLSVFTRIDPTRLGTILIFRYMFYVFSCCYNSRTIQYIEFKFEALLSYTKATKNVKFQCVWCTGVRVGIFRISPIEPEVSVASERF